MFFVITLVSFHILTIRADVSNLSIEKEEKADKIVNGNEVYPRYNYPYQALYVDGHLKCGGTIIGRRHVITADHCIKRKTPRRNTYVIVGEHEVSRAFGPNAEATFGSNLIRVKKFIEPRGQVRGNRKDISILQLERDIQYSDRIKPACIPARDAGNYAGRNAVVTGWGSTRGHSYAGRNTFLKPRRPQKVLLEATIKVLSPSSRQCKKHFYNKPHMLCAYRQGYDTCQGDSGGPMTIQENGKYVLIGVISSGRGCAVEDEAGVYTRVSYFHDWIMETVGDVCTPRSSGGRGSTKPLISNSASGGCSCSNYINPNGFGRCRKPDSDFGGSRSCYVVLPSSCSDLVRSSSDPSKYLSAKACSNGPPSEYTTPKPNSGCSCSNFVNAYGFGRCRKKDSDFGWRVSCYVELPSTCSDLIKSSNNLGKYLSAQACRRNEK